MRTYNLVLALGIVIASQTASAASLCRNCSLVLIFSDATGTGAGPAAQAAAASFQNSLMIASHMPLQSRPQLTGSGAGISLEVGTTEAYAKEHGLDGIDVAQAIKPLAAKELKEGSVGYSLRVEVRK